MCDAAVNDFLLTFNFVPNWVATRKMIENLMIFYVSVDRKINLDNVNFNEDVPETIIHVKLMA